MDENLHYIEIGKYFQDNHTSDFVVLSYSDNYMLKESWFRYYEIINPARFIKKNQPGLIFALLPYQQEDKYIFIHAELKREKQQSSRQYYQVRFIILNTETIRSYYTNGVQLFTILASNNQNESGKASTYSLKDYSEQEGISRLKLPPIDAVDSQWSDNVHPGTLTTIGAVLSSYKSETPGYSLITCEEDIDPILKLKIIEQTLSVLEYKNIFSFSTDGFEETPIQLRFLLNKTFLGKIHNRAFQITNLPYAKEEDADAVSQIIRLKGTKDFRGALYGLADHIYYLHWLLESYSNAYNKINQKIVIIDEIFALERALGNIRKIKELIYDIESDADFVEYKNQIISILSDLLHGNFRLLFQDFQEHFLQVTEEISNVINDIEKRTTFALKTNDFSELKYLSNSRSLFSKISKNTINNAIDALSSFLGKHTPAQIERYGNINYPRRVAMGAEFGIKIELGLTPKSNQSPLIVVPSDTPVREMKVDVVISFDEKDFENNEDFAKMIDINPYESSSPVLFSLKAISTGEKTVKIDFFHKGYYQGQTVANILVEDLAVEGVRGSLFDNFGAISNVSINIFNSTSVSSPDLTIYLGKAGENYEYRLYSNRQNLGFDLKKVLGKINISSVNPQAYMERIYEEINEKVNSQTDNNLFFEDINSIGTQLYDELFPKELKSIWWKKIHGRVQSILIVSDETWIPWELIKPYQKMEDGSIQEDGFLCEKYQLSRWLQGSNSLQNQIEFKDLRLIISDDMKELEGESEEFGDFASDQLHIENIPASLEKIFPLLTKGGFNALHFGCHSVYDNTNPDTSYLELNEGEKLKPRHISGEKVYFGQNHPLIFLNACASGRSAPSLTGIGGWAGRFLNIGVSAFIGAMWDVDNKSATPFANYFYKNLVQGMTIGEAAQKARLKIKKAGDPSWLSYIVYANPNSLTITNEVVAQIEDAKSVLNNLKGV